MTSDNVTTNDKYMRVLQRVLDDPYGCRWITSQWQARCFEHITHLGVKALIETICPTPSKIQESNTRV